MKEKNLKKMVGILTEKLKALCSKASQVLLICLAFGSFSGIVLTLVNPLKWWVYPVTIVSVIISIIILYLFLIIISKIPKRKTTQERKEIISMILVLIALPFYFWSARTMLYYGFQPLNTILAPYIISAVFIILSFFIVKILEIPPKEDEIIQIIDEYLNLLDSKTPELIHKEGIVEKILDKMTSYSGKLISTRALILNHTKEDKEVLKIISSSKNEILVDEIKDIFREIKAFLQECNPYGAIMKYNAILKILNNEILNQETSQSKLNLFVKIKKEFRPLNQRMQIIYTSVSVVSVLAMMILAIINFIKK